MASISQKLNVVPYSHRSKYFLVKNLREIYHELGEYEFKIIFNNKFVKHAKNSDIKIFDSDSKSMKYDVNIWGKKANCNIIIDSDVSDGVSYVDVSFVDIDEIDRICRIYFWVIKP